MFLRELNDSVSTLRGVGKAYQTTLAAAGIHTVAQLVMHIPRAYEDRINRIPFDSIEDDGIANTVVKIVDHEYFGFGSKRTLKIHVEDETGSGSLICFGRNFLSRVLVPGRDFYLYGQFTDKFGELQSTAFETEPFSQSPKLFCKVLPIYQLTGQLTQNFFRKTIAQILDRYGDQLEDELPGYVIDAHNLIRKKHAIRRIHFPSTVDQGADARRSLAFEELYHLQLAIKRRALKAKAGGREKRTLTGEWTERIIDRLPYKLTEDQRKVLREIHDDLERDTPMTRLLQGDVGCGKTIVALLSAVLLIERGYQVAIMAPTELLGRQHADSAAQVLEPAGISVGLLSGAVGSEARKHLLRAIADGAVQLVVGTHALFSADVHYNRLGMVIVDEQHRFGVLQRIALLQKASGGSSTPAYQNPDLLLMTATPIPRSLALTVFGDLDISTIRGLPPGRKPISTHLAKMGNEAKVYDWVRREVKKGHQAYFVYPLIEQSDKLDLKDAESMVNHLKKGIFPDFTLSLIHSRLPEEEKREAMSRFQKGEIQILVATSVVEVGVNVPNATCMVVEHAERFGLSALHQLRGRVGRAEYESYAFLVYSDELGEEAKDRLMAMKNNNDGFAIAEKDLSIRGPGELTGVQQSGRFRLDVADIVGDTELLLSARAEVVRLLEIDPGLLDQSNAQLRRVLQNAPPFSDELVDSG